jgi:hypothetical protein
MPEWCIIAAHALLASHQSAPADRSSAQTCFCALIATPARDFKLHEVGFCLNE